ncbi:SAM-dependent methyltransferase [Nocardia salmonicida]|uniref:SAM-dependent methyltransferase n=1 Tax=Nocardia salmonicida TaxID=53431 RepID=UPI0036A72B9C
MPTDPVLLDISTLEQSSVVANNTMNRGRGLSGVNSYTRELGFDPYEVLAECLRADPTARVTWVDVCCGSGRALLEAEQRFDREFPTADVTIIEAMTNWLAPTGLFTADFDPAEIRHPNGSPAAEAVIETLRAAGLTYDRHRIHGHGRPEFTATYLGADPTAGPGYTGQPSVVSYYDW